MIVSECAVTRPGSSKLAMRPVCPSRHGGTDSPNRRLILQVSATHFGGNRVYNRNCRRVKKLIPDKVLGSRYAVLRSVLAWSYFEYFSLSREARSTLESFQTVFEKTYPAEARNSRQIEQVPRKHNIFTGQETQTTFTELLKLWSLGNITELVTFPTLPKGTSR